MLILIQDSGDTRFIINIAEEAIKISSEFDSNEVIAMNKLCNELNEVKNNNTSLVLTKSKKEIALPTTC